MHLRMTGKDKVVEVILIVILLIIGIATLYPFLNVLALSFNQANDSVRGGITIFPRKWTLNNYRTVFGYPSLLTGFINSVVRTIIGSVLDVFCTAMLSYVLSRQEFQARRVFNFLFMLTMYVSGGLVPGYLLIRNLHMFNTFAVYIVPGLIGVFNVILMRSYMETLPASLHESAMLDGANDFTIFVRIIFPLAMPSIAAITLFYAVGHWNDWFTTYLYNSLSPDLTVLQYELMKILQSATSLQLQAAKNNDVQALIQMAKTGAITPQSIQMAITIVVIVPIIIVYPFLQKYFVSGMTIGAVKG